MLTNDTTTYHVIDMTKPEDAPSRFECKVAAQAAAVTLSRSRGNAPVYVTGPGVAAEGGKTRYPVLFQANGDPLKSRRGYKANVSVRPPALSRLTVIHHPAACSPSGAARPASFGTEAIIGLG